MAIIYDFLFLDRLSNSEHFFGASVVERFEREVPIRDSSSAVTIFADYINRASRNNNFNLPDECITAIDQLNAISSKFVKAEGTSAYYTEFKELLEVLAFYGYETYLIERFDLEINDPVEDKVKAYLINEMDEVLPDFKRVSGGWCSLYDEPEAASLADVEIDFLSDVIRFSESAESLVHLNKEVSDFRLLRSSGAKSMYDPTPIDKFMASNGYKTLIIVG
jgi:hypothetical protein